MKSIILVGASRRLLVHFRGTLGFGLSLLSFLAGPAAMAALDLGPAAGFSVFQMGAPMTGGGSWTSSDVTVEGNVAFLTTTPGGNAFTIVNGNVEGTITPSAFAGRNWTVSGTYTQVAPSTLLGDAATAQTFSTDAASFTGLPNIGAVTGPATYTFTAANLAAPGTYILNTTSINLSGTGTSFTLDGSMLPAGSRVIVNVANSFALPGGGSILLSGGLTPSQVLINYTGTSTAVLSTGTGTSIFGTFLGPNTTANFSGATSVVLGSLLAENVNLSSHVTIVGMPFESLPSVPEPSTFIAGALLLLPFGASALRILRRRQNAQNLS